jgi:RimJ/RimL family protein N-acetyltransferase
VLDAPGRCKRWLDARVTWDGVGPGDVTCIGWEVGGELRAVAMYFHQTSREVRMAIAVDKLGSGGKAFLRAVFRYPFVQLGVARITSEIDADNARSIRLAEHSGFKVEGRKREGVANGDVLYYGMLRSECRYI